MTERQQKLISSYGESFYVRSGEIKNEFLYLMADAASVLTDEECSNLSKTVEAVLTEINKTQEIVRNRMKEVGLSVI